MAQQIRGSNSVVECHLAKVDVEGSSPFSRSLEAKLNRPVGTQCPPGRFRPWGRYVPLPYHLPPSPLARPKLRIAMAVVDETHWLCMSYLNAVRRRIRPLPRMVERAHTLSGNPLARQYASVIDEIEETSRLGGDLCPRLSTRVDDLQYDDALLNDWSIYHLHLGTLGAGPGARAGRTGPLLFVFVRENRVYFLDVLMHGKNHRPWTRQGLIETIHSNWPDVIRRYRVFGLPPEHVSDDQIAALRANNVNKFATTKDSTVYAPFGGGYMASGLSQDVLMATDRFCSTIDALQQWAEKNPEAIRDAILQQRGITLNEVEMSLLFTGGEFQMIEAASRSGLLFPSKPEDKLAPLRLG
jgi:hypothetical protein